MHGRLVLLAVVFPANFTIAFLGVDGIWRIDTVRNTQQARSVQVSVGQFVICRMAYRDCWSDRYYFHAVFCTNQPTNSAHESHTIIRR
jgi:hypothetical protein